MDTSNRCAEDHMDRRQSERKLFSADAEIISEGSAFRGVIENVSEEGIEYLMTSKVSFPAGVTPDKLIQLSFSSPSGEKIALRCEVKWFLKTDALEGGTMLGVRIINPPHRYREMMKSVSG